MTETNTTNLRAPTKPPRSKPTQFNGSMTGVYPARTHGVGLWGNERTVFSVRVDSGLAAAFTKVAKAKFGSTCNPVESFMASVVGVYQNPTLDGVNPSITIGEIKIERNLRERRKVVIEREEVTETKTVFAKQEQTLAKIRAAGKRCISAATVDYSKIPSDQLKIRLQVSIERGRLADADFCAAELKRRGELVP